MPQKGDTKIIVLFNTNYVDAKRKRRGKYEQL